MKTRTGFLWPFLTALGAVGAGRCPGQGCHYFAWKNPVSGDYTNGGLWDTAAPECRGQVPAPDDGVGFRQGTYTVTIPGMQTASFAEFAPAFDGSPQEFDITFNLTGSFHSGYPLATAGRLTLNGGGNLSAAGYIFAPGADLIIDDASVTLGSVVAGNVAPPDQTKQILVRTNGELTTTGPTSLYGVTLDGGTWIHTGPANQFGPQELHLNGTAKLQGPAIAIRNALPVRANDASEVDIDEFTATWIELKGSSRMTNQNAKMTSQLAKTAEGAARWTVVDTMTITEAGQVMAINAGHITCGRIDLADENGFAQLFSRGPGSTVTVGQSLKVGPAWAAAQQGGTIVAPDIEVRAGGLVEATDAGSLLTCDGPLKVGSVSAGAAQTRITKGGRATAHSLAVGFSNQANTVTVDGANGTSRLELAEKIEVGKEGKGTLVVRAGGRIGFTEALEGFIAVTPAGSKAAGDGEVSVDGANSLLDLNGGSLGVGISNAGRLFVSGGGKVVAGALDVGTNFDGGASPSLARVIGANSKIELTEAVRIWVGTLRIQSGGFVQVIPTGPGTRITLITPALVDLAGGSAEIGSAGPPPSGMLRVADGFLNGSGTIRGSVEVISQGVCSPGSEESNILKIEAGTYRQEATGTLESEIRGAGPEDTDLLDVSGNVTLNGRLRVDFGEGFAPVSGSSFGIVRFGGTLTGAFSTVDVHGLAPGFSVAQQLISPGLHGIVITGSISAATCPGPPPLIEEIRAGDQGGIVMSLINVPCDRYRLEYSTDLLTWRWLRDFAGHPSGRVTLTDRRPYLSTSYYRVVVP